MIQALCSSIEEIQSQATKIIRNERTAKIEDRNGVLQLVPDTGGRHCFESLVLDVQASVRGFDETAQGNLERAVADADGRFTVCPSALAMPTQAPLDSFSPKTWPACYVEWWFGDCAPGL